MRKFVALLPWNLYLMLSAVKAFSEGLHHPVFQFPLLGQAHAITGPLAITLCALLVFCAWASYRILFDRGEAGRADWLHDYVIFLGCRYVVPAIILIFITPAEQLAFRQPIPENPVFWMAFGYFLMIDTVIFRRGFRPETALCVQLFGWQLTVQVRFIFCMSVFVQTGYVASELHKYSVSGTDGKRTEAVRNG